MGYYVHDSSKVTTVISRSFVAVIVKQALLQCIPDGNSGGNEPTELARELFSSSAADAVRTEIIEIGRKLWLREYVDGNGGNISYRISSDYVLCTPTLCSKGDLNIEDICMVDLDGQRVLGPRPCTSEILLHLEIYKAVPRARAVIHCHPPHATAYAITGLVPPGVIIPEQEVFVGPVALAPYDTPGTKAFAETVLPYVHSHNTILLANHGVVCWADTVTHAEWCVEVFDTYCRTLILAAQLGSPINHIPANKVGDLLEIKRNLGLPDARFGDPPPTNGNGQKLISHRDQRRRLSDPEFEALISSITDQIVTALTLEREQRACGAE
jgi:L-fuculose-phosphate aldolase